MFKHVSRFFNVFANKRDMAKAFNFLHIMCPQLLLFSLDKLE